MQFFILFIFGAVIFGAGAMFAPAWHTSQPRVGLAATLALALVVGGAVFWAELFGWDTLVIDYLLFALMSSVVLGGTLSQAQERAEAKGEELSDAEQGWPGPEDLAFFGIVSLIVMLPLFLFRLPLGADASTTSYLTLTARFGGSFDTLAPYHPDVQVLFSPGFHALTAYLSQQLGQPIPMIQMAVGAVMTLLSIWLVYDFGAELRDKRLGRAMAGALLISFGLLGAYLNGHFTIILGLCFSLAFLLYLLRFMRHGFPMDLVAAGLMLGAVIYANPTMTLIISMGFIAWLIAWWFTDDASTRGKRFLQAALGIPLVALLGISPWLVNNLDLFALDFASADGSSLSNLWVMIGYQGVWMLPLAIFGAWVGWRNEKLRQLIIFCGIWLILVLDFAVTGLIPTLLPFIGRFVHGQSIGWHGVIIPYGLLAGIGLIWLWENVVTKSVKQQLRRNIYPILSSLALLILLIGLSGDVTRDILIRAAQAEDTITSGDMDTLLWLRENATDDARILNHPQDKGWAASVTEHDAIYFELQPYFINTESIQAEQELLLSFWDDPTDSTNESLLQENDIDYIVVPENLSDIDEILSDLPYLEQVFDGVYQVK